MTEKLNTLTEAELAAINNSFDHAMRVLVDAQRAVVNNGTQPPVVASALCASYVTYVAALVAASGLPKEDVASACKDGIDTMPEFISAAYDRMVKEIAKEAL